MRTDEILFGPAYYDEYMPYDRLETDFQMMKKAGMNVIRIAESTWSTWEPTEGVFDFTRLHRMLDAAVKYDLKVIVGTPTYAIPSWLALKHPAVLSFSKNGQELYGHRQLTDITNPDYLFYAERIIRKLMAEVKDYPNVIGFQLDNETRAAGAASPETQQLFIRKMQEKYPNIEDFNQEFGLDYWSNRVQRWEDFPDVRGTINGSLSAAYKRFLRECITDFLHWQERILREYMRPGQFITHNFDYSWIEYSFGIQPLVNQYDAASFMDVAGVDIYHLTQDKLTGAMITFGGAVGRSLKKDNYLVLETQSQGRLDWLPYPGQLRLQAYSHLSCGANSVMYWNWHSIHNSFESYWRGILSHNLAKNETYDELSVFGKELKQLGNHLRNLQKTCKVAILTDVSSLVGLEEFPISDSLDYNTILRWMFDACYELNLECDLVCAEDNFDDYSLLLVPAFYSATEKSIQKLRNFVALGGHLLYGFKSGYADEEIKIYHDNQPHRMTDCIGATYDRFTKPEKVSLQFCEKIDDTPCDTTISDGALFEVSEWMELVNAENAEVWAQYVHPFWGKYAAITHNHFGSGTATYLACYTTKDALKHLIRKLTAVAGIALPKVTFPVIIKHGTNDAGKEILYYLNYSSEEQTVCYDQADGTELFSGKKIHTNESIVLKPWDLAIIEV